MSVVKYTDIRRSHIRPDTLMIDIGLLHISYFFSNEKRNSFMGWEDLSYYVVEEAIWDVVRLPMEKRQRRWRRINLRRVRQETTNILVNNVEQHLTFLFKFHLCADFAVHDLFDERDVCQSTYGKLVIQRMVWGHGDRPIAHCIIGMFRR